MKTIGIITLYFNSQNIGGLLQAYALPALLQEHHFSAEQIVIDYTARNFKKRLSDAILTIKAHTLKQLVQKLGSRLRLFQNHSSQTIPDLQKQTSLFVQFRKFINHSIPVSSLCFVNYDSLIIGSDQVWGSNFLRTPIFWGPFPTTAIAYAASSNITEFSPKQESFVCAHLKNFSAISVREKTLKDYVERITDKKVTVVLDPTFLLSPDKWLKIANPASVPQKPYIFCYFLGEKSAWQRQKAQEYADKYGYELVHLPYIMQTVRPADCFLKGQGHCDVGPREFIALIQGAQCVFTDSFHGLAFSINFGKNFYVFNRDDNSGPNSMNARITDTLATFGLTARHITDKNVVLDNTPLDFTEAHKILTYEKEKSINWLLNALKN